MKNKLVYLPFRLKDFRPFLLLKLFTATRANLSPPQSGPSECKRITKFVILITATIVK
jgi:hypothetical protein